jgi:hypothetical protein
MLREVYFVMIPTKLENGLYGILIMTFGRKRRCKAKQTAEQPALDKRV